MEDEVQQLKKKVARLESRLKSLWQLYKDSQTVVEQYERILQNQETDKLLVFSQVSSSCCSQQPNAEVYPHSCSSSPVNSTASQYAAPPPPTLASMDLLAPVREYNNYDAVMQTPSSQQQQDSNGMKVSPIAFPTKLPAPIDFEEADSQEDNDEYGFAPPAEKRQVKFQEAVRGKEARQALPGHSCKECQLFYETIKDTLHPGEDVQTVMNRYSRHRHRHKPPSTPPGYWDVWSLPVEEETEDQQQVKRRKI